MSSTALEMGKILVVDDHPLVRRGIIDILSMNGKQEVFEGSNLAAAKAILKEKRIDIVIIDLNLGNENGFELVEMVKSSYPDIKNVVLTSSSNIFDYKKAMELDVDAYIIKDAFIEDIVYALQVVSRGGKYYSPQIIQQSMNGFMPKELMELTDREKEILAHLSKGMTNAQISNALFIAESTTKKHISNILSKLKLNNRVEAVLYTKKLFES